MLTRILTIIVYSLLLCKGYCDDAPLEIQQLSSENLETRASAYQALTKRGLEDAESVIPHLKSGMNGGSDPEVQLRCQSLLRDIYLRLHLPKRLGFLGVSQGPEQIVFNGESYNAVGIAHVQEGSAAHTAGLHINDDIISFNGGDFNDIDIRDLIHEFRNMVESAGMGAEIQLGVVRNGKLLKLSARLGVSPNDTRDFSEIENRFPLWLKSK